MVSILFVRSILAVSRSLNGIGDPHRWSLVVVCILWGPWVRVRLLLFGLIESVLVLRRVRKDSVLFSLRLFQAWRIVLARLLFWFCGSWGWNYHVVNYLIFRGLLVLNWWDWKGIVLWMLRVCDLILRFNLSSLSNEFSFFSSHCFVSGRFSIWNWCRSWRSLRLWLIFRSGLWRCGGWSCCHWSRIGRAVRYDRRIVLTWNIKEHGLSIDIASCTDGRLPWVLVCGNTHAYTLALLLALLESHHVTIEVVWFASAFIFVAASACVASEVSCTNFIWISTTGVANWDSLFSGRVGASAIWFLKAFNFFGISPNGTFLENCNFTWWCKVICNCWIRGICSLVSRGSLLGSSSISDNWGGGWSSNCSICAIGWSWGSGWLSGTSWHVRYRRVCCIWFSNLSQLERRVRFCFHLQEVHELVFKDFIFGERSGFSSSIIVIIQVGSIWQLSQWWRDILKIGFHLKTIGSIRHQIERYHRRQAYNIWVHSNLYKTWIIIIKPFEGWLFNEIKSIYPNNWGFGVLGFWG